MFKAMSDGDRGGFHLGWNLGALQEVFKAGRLSSTLLESLTDEVMLD